MSEEQLQVARETYHALWPKSVHSSFGYYAQLLDFSGIPAAEFVEHGIKKNRIPAKMRSLIEQKIKDASLADLEHLYKNNHGPCTAWCLLVAETVEEELGLVNEQRFRFADTKGHRLAFNRSGVLIDSSLKTVIELVEGKPVLCGEFEFTIDSLEAENPKFSYTRKKGDPYPTTMCRDRQDALQRCLLQFLTKTTTVIGYFRTAHNDELGFDGMIKWEKGSNVVTWSEEDGTKQGAMFGCEGTQESLITCNEALALWTEKTSTRAAQWVLIKDDFQQLWNALAIAHGMPKLI